MCIIIITFEKYSISRQILQTIFYIQYKSYVIQNIKYFISKVKRDIEFKKIYILNY